MSFEQHVEDRVKGALAASQIKLVDTFYDDGILCVVFTVDNTKLTLMWCGEEVVGAIRYSFMNGKPLDYLANHLIEKLCDNDTRNMIAESDYDGQLYKWLDFNYDEVYVDV